MLSLYWAIAGIILIISEFFIPGFVIFFFGAGALLNALLTAVIPALKSNILVQVIIWLGFSGLSLFTLRRYFARIFRGLFLDSRSSTDQAGEKVDVVEDISPKKPGRIRYQGTTWRAVSFTESFKAGEKVEILKKENLTFVVTRSLLGGDMIDDVEPGDSAGRDGE
jgi:membrane protein implicated in regulation of membrane protease activity